MPGRASRIILARAGREAPSLTPLSLFMRPSEFHGRFIVHANGPEAQTFADRSNYY